MEEWIDFAKGPLFRFSFAVMCLGLLRLLVLSIVRGYEMKAKAKDRNLPKAYVNTLTFGYLLPIRAFRQKPFYSFVSVLFHIGLIVTPILLFDHNLLFKNSIGLSLIGISLPKVVADYLTALCIVTAVLLLLMRLSNRNTRFISRAQDYLLLLLLIVPFVSGLIMSQLNLAPGAYDWFIFIHIAAGCVIFLLLPFTKLAHVVLLPVGQWITAWSWKFAPNAPEETVVDLGKEGVKL